MPTAAGAAAEDAAEGRTLADFFPKQAQHFLAVAEGENAGFHGHAEHDGCFDGVDADVVHDAVGPGDVIQIVDATVGAKTPDGLILETGGDVFAVLVIVNLRTLDDAAGMAAMLRLAAAGNDGLVHGLAGNLVVAVELTNGKVPGRQAAGFVEDVDQDVGAIGGQTLTADRMIKQGLGKGARRNLEFFRLGDLDAGSPFVVDGDELYLLRTHDGAKTTTAVAADLAVRVLDRDVGGGHFQLTGGADGEDAGLLAETGLKCLDHRKVPLADQFLLFLNGNAVLGDMEAVPLVFLGQAFDDEGLDGETGQHLRCSTTGVAFLDGAGQRALGSCRKTTRVGCGSTGQKPRSKDQFVVRSQGVAGGRDFCSNDGRGQAATAETGPASRDRLRFWC